MTGFSMGRIGLSSAYGGDGLSFSHPFAWQQQGLQISLQGLHVCSSDAQAVWLANNIVGLDPAANPDEPWIPVCSQTVTQLCVMLRVTSAQAVIDRGSLNGGNKVVQWQVTGERALSGGNNARVELSTISSLVQNGWSVTQYAACQSIPQGSYMRGYVSPSADSTTRTGQNGTAEVRLFSAGTANVYSGSTIMVYEPDRHYDASASIQSSDGMIVGRRDLTWTTDPWYAGNGLVRFKANTGVITFEWWNGSTWVGTTNFNVYVNSLQVGFVRQLVLRNTPEECVLRLTGQTTISHATGGTVSEKEITVDISVRRGDLFGKLYVTSVDSVAHNLRFASNTTCVTTNTTGGIRTSATVSSRYIFMTSDYATTTDTTNGRLTSGSRTRTMFAIGSAATTTGDLSGVAGLSKQAFAAWGEAQRVAVTG